MNKQILQIIFLVITLIAIWAIIKFGIGLYSIPLWIIIFSVTKFNSMQLTSVLIVSEFFIGIDTLTLGPFSIIQIIGVSLLLSNIKAVKKNYFSNSVFLILLLLLFYFSFSYYQYFRELSMAPINWIFIYILTIISFNGKKSDFHFVGWLTVISITSIALVNFIIQISFGISAVKIIAFGNPNQIGFFSLYALIYIIYLYGAFEKKNARVLKFLFYFNALCIVFTGSRLNTGMLLIFIILLGIYPIKGIWIKQKTLILSFAFLIIIIIIGGGIKTFFFRNNENEELKSLTLSNLEDLNDSYLVSFTNARSKIYYDAIELIKEKPIFGNGFLSWNDKDNTYNSLITSNTGSRISMHSTLLQYLAETGIIGLLLYLMYFLKIAHNGRKLIKGYFSKDYYYSGQLITFITLFIFLGSTFDNHSLSYAQIHFIGGISIVMISKVNNEQAHEY